MYRNRLIKIASMVLLFSLLLTQSPQAAGLNSINQQSLSRPEEEVRFSTSLTGELADSLEIVGVTVLPLVKSGNIAFESSDSYSAKTDLGALLNIYIKNKSSSQISPQVTFNGKTASQLIDQADNTVSWANTPDTRANRKYDKDRLPGGDPEFANFIPLTTYIPAGDVDCYSINICDAKLLYNGIDFVITADGKSASAKLYGDYQYVNVSRLMWRSTENNRYYPDEVIYYIDNKSLKTATVNYVRFYDGTDEYNLHYWSEAGSQVSIFNNVGTVQADQPACGTVKFVNPLAFKEYLIEFNITNNGRTYSIFQKTKPLVNDFDISVGWANSDVAILPYLKAISSCHFNTVIYDFGGSYQNYPQDIKDTYPIKAFGGIEGYTFGSQANSTTGVRDIDSVHAALPFGEPQLDDNPDNFQPMRVFNKLLTYRNSCYPTNMTLSHEPFFYRYAGLSDLNHYDAYRVVAPFSDAWYKYYNYAAQGKYGIYWGAPLETTGDYMRTLDALNAPNPVAAWTQGANSWNGFRRFTKDEQYYYSPNPFEIRIQAYENIANGAASLYWFNINIGDLLYYKAGSRETMYVNRELSVVADYLSHQVPYFYTRSNNYDLNLNMGTDYALLYAIDLNYAAKDSMYQYKGMRKNQTFTFEVPSYLSGANCVVKISKDGVSKCDDVAFNGNKITITDNVDMTAMYMLGNQSIFQTLETKYNQVMAKETYNYLDNGGYYQELQSAAGYSNKNPYVPEILKENSTLLLKVAYALLNIIVLPLEALVTKLAAMFYSVARYFI